MWAKQFPDDDVDVFLLAREDGAVTCAKGMRVFLKRDEDYYAPMDVESEDHPEHDLEREDV